MKVKVSTRIRETDTNNEGERDMEITIKVSRTKTNLPAVSETGGASGKTKGEARIFCRDNGSKKIATHIPKPDNFEVDGHAVFILQKYDYVILIERSRTTVYKVTIAQFTGDIDAEDNAVFAVRHIKQAKRWDVQPPEYLQPAIDAAVAKSSQEDIAEAIWFERKQPPVIGTPVPLSAIKNQAPVQAFAQQYVPGFVVIQDVRQKADDEISVCLTNGVQLCVYIKACTPRDYKSAGE
jgi:hypothetical protein